jgi:hypothetical protein
MYHDLNEALRFDGAVDTGTDVAILFRTHGDTDIIQHMRCVR